MSESFLDPQFESRLERSLSDFAQVAVRPYDAVEIAALAMATGRALTGGRFAVPGWFRTALLLSILTVLIVVAGVVGGFIRLPSNDLEPNPSFQPFSPPPFSPLPSDGSGASFPPSPDVTLVPGSGPPASDVPQTLLPASPTAPAESAEPSLDPSPSLSPEPPLSPEPSPVVTPTITPAPITPINDALSISAGQYFTCATRVSGTVACWGANAWGQLGNGTQTDSAVPVQVVGINNATRVATGSAHTCVVHTSGLVSCWGYGGPRIGQYDNGDPQLVPVAVAGIFDAVDISASNTDTCALRSVGIVTCFGEKMDGDIPGLTDATSISLSGESTACAVRSTGAVVCWGWNYAGQLGNGTTTDSATPVEVSGLTDAVAVNVGGGHACAVRSNGSVMCWGSNLYGQLGNADYYGTHYTPEAVEGVTDAINVSASSVGHTCALRSTGGVLCWGWNPYGQLGTGGGQTTTPVAPVGLGAMRALSAGFWDTCTIDISRGLWCWGFNASGEVGDGTTIQRDTPVRAGQ